MNMTMVDVTDVPGLDPGDEVVLLGRDGDAVLTAEQLASWIGTINYEVTTASAPTCREGRGAPGVLRSPRADHAALTVRFDFRLSTA